jgi:hypothetical protein
MTTREALEAWENAIDNVDMNRPLLSISRLQIAGEELASRLRDIEGAWEQ